MHNSCCITLCSKKREQAIIRDATAREAAEEIPTSTSKFPIHSDSLPTSPLKKKHNYQQDSFTKKDQCVGCMKKEDKKHPNRPSSKLLRIEQSSRWQDFKGHVPFLKDTNMRRWITYSLTLHQILLLQIYHTIGHVLLQIYHTIGHIGQNTFFAIWIND